MYVYDVVKIKYYLSFWLQKGDIFNCKGIIKSVNLVQSSRIYILITCLLRKLKRPKYVGPNRVECTFLSNTNYFILFDGRGVFTLLPKVQKKRGTLHDFAFTLAQGPC